MGYGVRYFCFVNPRLQGVDYCLEYLSAFRDTLIPIRAASLGPILEFNHGANVNGTVGGAWDELAPLFIAPFCFDKYTNIVCGPLGGGFFERAWTQNVVNVAIALKGGTPSLKEWEILQKFQAVIVPERPVLDALKEFGKLNFFHVPPHAPSLQELLRSLNENPILL